MSERTTRLERGKGKGRTFGSLLDGLVGLDVAGHGDAAEEGADEERGDLEHGQKRGPAGAGVVDEQPLWDFWPKRTGQHRSAEAYIVRSRMHRTRSRLGLCLCCRAGLPLGDGVGNLGGLRGRIAGVQAKDDAVAPGSQELGGALRRGDPGGGAGMLSYEMREQPGTDCCELAHRGDATRMAVMRCVDGDFEDEVDFGWSQFEDGAGRGLGSTAILMLAFIVASSISTHFVY